jgi:hypothetical protein
MQYGTKMGEKMGQQEESKWDKRMREHGTD